MEEIYRGATVLSTKKGGTGFTGLQERKVGEKQREKIYFLSAFLYIEMTNILRRRNSTI